MEQGSRSYMSRQGMAFIQGFLPTLLPLPSKVTGSRNQWEEAPQGLPPAQMNLEYLFLREKLEEWPQHLILALQHLSHTSITYSQDVGEEVDGRTEAHTG